VGAYLDTQPTGDRRKLARAFAETTIKAGFAAAPLRLAVCPAAPFVASLPAVNPDYGFLSDLPNYDSLFKSATLLTGEDKFKVVKSGEREKMLGFIKNVFTQDRPEEGLLATRVAPPQKNGGYKQDGDRASLTHEVAFGFQRQNRGPIYTVNTLVTAESDGAPLDASMTHNWRITSVELVKGEVQPFEEFIRQTIGTDREKLPPGFQVPAPNLLFHKRLGVKIKMDEGGPPGEGAMVPPK
jgi:hypothetical protein